MYYFQRKSKHKTKLVEKTIKALNERICPACGDQLKITEQGSDRDTYACEKCKSLTTFTKLPSNIRKEEKVTKMGMLTVREQPKKEEQKSKEEKPASVDETLGVIRECMTTQSIGNFYYTGSDGKTTLRNAEPYKIMKDKNGEIVLYAYDIESEGIKVFKVKGMKTFLKQEFTYKPRWAVEDKLDKS